MSSTDVRFLAVWTWAKAIERFLAGSRIVWVFLAIAAPSCGFLVIATPPFQTPDAPNHFFRAYQVSRGVLIGKHVGGSSGGFIDSGVVAFGGLEEPLKFHKERKWTDTLAIEAVNAKLTKEEIPTAFPNTAPYPAPNYLPQAIAFLVFGHGDGSLLRIYRFACLFNAICAIGMTALALRLARHTRPLIFVVALLPMTLSLMASVSQDATLIPLGFLIIGWFDFLCFTQKPLTRNTAIGLAVLITTASIARIPYIAFMLLFLHPSIRVTASSEGYGWLRRLVWAAPTFVAIAIIYLVQTHLASGNMRSGRSMGAQTQYVLTHLSSIPELIRQTFITYGGLYVRSFVGVLGWLDTYFPTGVYSVAKVIILLTIVYGALRRSADDRNPSSLFTPLWPFLSFLASCALIFYGLYAFWSAVGAKEIEGVQGRYFLPIFPLLAMVIVPFVSRRLSETRLLTGTRAVIAVAVLGLPVVMFFETIELILERFYVG
ncbi:putative membrane protein [Paraburkholderia sp. GAS41]|uniref:DUF2142 domain-containing protein n=1 Tax=Paraburkholderia sp. GAS41 TaxID=3035134 RepID=UPI003D1D2796